MSNRRFTGARVRLAIVVSVFAIAALTMTAAGASAERFAFIDQVREFIGMAPAQTAVINTAPENSTSPTTLKSETEPMFLTNNGSITSLGSALTENFNTLAQSGTSNTWTNDTTIPGWYSDRTVYIADTGSDTTGGIHSYGSASNSDRALGGLSSGSASPVFGAKFTNNTGTTITSIDVSYQGEQWRQTTNSQTLTFDYQVGASAINSGTWTAVTALDFAALKTGTAGTLDGNATGNKATKSSTITVSVSNGQTIWLRWSKAGSTSPGLAVDDLSVTANGASATNYYSKSTGNLDVLSNWGTNTDGTGTAPTDFTSANQTFNIRNNATPTIGASWTVSGSGSKVIVGDGTNATNFTIPSSFAVTGTVDVAAAATLTIQHTNSPTFGTLAGTSTVVYDGAGAQAITAANYGNLTLSNSGSRSLSGTVGISGTFNPGSATVSTGTFDFNGSGSQTIPAFNYPNLTSSNTGARTLASSGTIGIAGTFTPGTNTYTNTGSTIDYNGTGAQSVPAFVYNNLSISGSHAGNITLASAGNIDIAGAFNPTATFTSGNYVNTTSTIRFTSAASQTVPAFNYATLTNGTSPGPRVLSSTGTIGIATAITANGASYTVTGSTVDFNGSAGATIAGSPTYNNLIISGTGTYTFNANNTIAGDFSQTAASTVVVNASTARTLSVGGNMALSAGTFILGNASGNTSTAVNVTGNVTVSGTGKINLEAVSSTSGASALNVTGNFTSTGTTVASAGANGVVDFGTGTVTGNAINITGNFSKSGTGTFGTAATTASSGFVFTGGGSHTFSYSGADSQYTQYAVNSGNTLTMSTGLNLVSGTNPRSTFTVNGTVDFGTQVLAAVASSSDPTFTLASTGTLRTGNATGINGSITLPGTKTLDAGATYVYNGTVNQAVGALLPSSVANLTIANTGGSGNETVTGNSGQTVTGLLRVQSGIYSAASTYNNFQIDSGATYNATGPVSVSGTWTNNGTFTANSNGVTLNGTGAQAVNGSTTFYDLTASASTARTITFEAGKTQTVSNSLSLNGAAGQLLSLRSSASPTAWLLSAPSTQSISYVDVKDSNASGGNLVSQTNSTDSGNNSNWAFSHTITASSGGNGSVTPAGASVVAYNGSQAYTIAPDTGYHVVDVLVDSVSQGAISNYTFNSVTADHTISATFAINTYTITASAGTGGSIAPNGATVKNYNESQAYTITADSGYLIDTVLVDGVNNPAAVTSGTYTFSNIQANHTISATFVVSTPDTPSVTGSPQTYTGSPITITVSCASGGTATSITPADATNAGSTAVTASCPGNGSYAATTNAAAGNFVINAATPTVTVTVGSYTYNTSPNGPTAFTTNPTGDGGAATWTYEGTGATSYGPSSTRPTDAGTYTAQVSLAADAPNFNAASSAATAFTIAKATPTVTFGAAPTPSYPGADFNVSATTTGDGAITYSYVSGPCSFVSGSTFSPTGVGTCGVQADSAATTNYNAASSTQNVTITQATFTVSVTVTGNGSIGIAGVEPTETDCRGATCIVTQPYGQAITLNAHPDAHNHLGSWGGDCAGTPIEQSCHLNGDSNAPGYNSNRTATAAFVLDTHTLTYSGNANTGGTAPSSVTQNYNTTTSVATAGSLVKTGYTFAGWNTASDGSGTGYAPSDTFTFTADTTLYAQWTINSYTITASAGPGGSISPSGTVPVNHGANQAFSITPDAGYSVSDVVVDSVSVGAMSLYTFNNVTANHTITASFALNTLNINTTSDLVGGTYGNVNIQSGAVVTLTGNVTILGTLTVEDGATLKTGDPFTSSDFHIEGGNFEFYDNAKLIITSPDGITTPGCGTGATCGSIRTTTRSFSSLGNYVYFAGGNQSVGNALPSTVANLTIDNSGTAPNNKVTGNPGQIVTSTLTILEGTFESHSDYHHVVIDSGGTLTLTGNTTVSGNWTNNGGTLNGNYTVILDGTDQTISGNTTFYGLSKTVTTARTLTFAAGSTTTVTNALTLTGAASNLLSLRSGTAATQWNIIATGTRSLNYLDVMDSDATGSGTALSATNSTGSIGQNNTFWSFPYNTFTITYVAGSGGTISGTNPQVINQGDNGTSVTAVPSAGYSFVTWDDSNTSATRSEMNVQADATYTATFAVNNYTVTYDGNGSDGGTTPAGQSGDYNTSITAAANTFTRTGHTFTGWNTAANGSGTPVAAGGSYTIPASNTTLYAQWSVNNYSITYNGNGNTGGSAPAGGSYAYGSSQTLAAAGSLSKTGYTFTGWDTVASGNGANYPAGSSYTIPAANTTFYAQWTLNSYTINASAGANGTITPSGAVAVNHGANQTFTFTPNSGYNVSSVTVDSVSVPVASSYTFTNVTAGHTIAVTFSQCAAISTASQNAYNGANVTIPVTTSDITASNVISAQFTFTYDQNVLSPNVADISVTAGSVLPTGGSAPTIDVNADNPGIIYVSIYGSAAFSGAGTVANINMKVLGLAPATSPLTLSDFLFNGGYVCCDTTSGTLTVVLTPQTINVTTAAPSTAAYGSSFNVAANATSGLDVTITATGGCTVSSGGTNSATITMTSSTVACVVHYNQGGNAVYAAATEVTSTTSATKADQTITFGVLGNKTYGDADFNVSAVASSGLAVSFSSQTPLVCTVSGNTVHIVSAGTCTVRASQGGDALYNAAPDVDRSFTVGARTLTVTATGINKVYDGNASASVTLGDDRISGDVVTTAYTTASFNNKNVGTAKLVSVSGISITGGAQAANYVLGNTTASTTADITARTLTVTATGVNKVYDGNATATVTLGDDRVSGDALTFSYSASFDNKNVGTAKPVSVTAVTVTGGADAGNYVLGNTTASTTADITARTLTVTATGINKVYDGNATATVTLGDDRVSGDVVTTAYTSASFNNKNVGTGKPVSVTGISITGGTDAGNYVLGNTTASTTADITARTLTVTATGINKVYDGNATATVTLGDDRVSGDALTFSYSASFDNKNVGTGKPVSVTAITVTGGADAGNYVLGNTTASTTADITARTLTVTATGINKVYDGNASATVTLGDDRVSGDALTFSYSASFNNKNVGITKPVSVSAITITGGLDALNYVLGNTTASTTADITARTLTVTATGINKVYDGNANASVTLGDDRVSGDDVTTAYTSASFNNKNVGTVKPVSVSGISITGGTDAGNYALGNTTASTTADITARALTVTATGINKVYDGNSTATVTLGDDRVSGDVVTTAYASASFNNKNVGTGKPVSVTGISITGGTDAGNYTLGNTTASTTADITARTLTVTATGINKVYDGNANATVTLGDDRVSGDALTFSYSASFDNKNVGTGKPVSVTAITVTGGADAGNYVLGNTTASTTADITARTLTVTATGINKVYDGNATATVTLGDDRVSGDVITTAYTSASFDNKNVGTGKPVSVTGISITGGTDAGNYVLGNTTASTTADITPLAATWTTSPASKAFGDADPSPLTTGSGSGFLPGEIGNISATYSRVSGEAAGTYQITATLSATAPVDLNNYTITNAGALFTINARTLTGTVTYANAVSPPVIVENTTITATGAAPLPAPVVNLADGTYSMSGFGTGSYHITASKPTEPCGTGHGIYANDASKISRAVVHLETLTATQLEAGKVAGLPNLSSFDAALVAQYIVCISNPLSQVGQWKFTPSDLIVTPTSVLNFEGILKGDVTGSWTEHGPGLRTVNPDDRRNAVRASVPAMQAMPGTTVDVPLRLENLRGESVGSYQFDIAYDPAVIEPAMAAASITGTISDGLTVVSNSPEPGLLKVVVYGVTPVNGDGVYVNLRFAAIGGAGTTSGLSIEGFRFNEGETPVYSVNGSVSVAAANDVAIRGRLLTANGMPVSNTRVILTSTTGARYAAQSNNFGYFEFGGLVIGESYTVNVRSNRFVFAPVTVSAQAGVTELEMIAEQ